MDTLPALKRAAKDYAAASRKREAAAVVRDDLIRRALAEHVPVSVIAQVTGLTPMRVRQIAKRTR